jgi:serine/threonine protein kinase
MPEILEKGDLIFEQYKVTDFITSGGQAMCWKGEDLLSPPSRPWQKSVFIKQYNDLIPKSEKAVTLMGHFETLQRRFKKKKHYLCLPKYVGETHSSIVAVFPYIKGKTLRQRMEEGLSPDECIEPVLAIANAVRLLNKNGVAHLDLSPSNIMISKKNSKIYVQIIDTDAAKIDGVGLRDDLIGKPGYRSPEHFAPNQFGNPTEKSDVFSLGIILFELFFKEHPFQDAKNYEKAVVNKIYKVPKNQFHRDIVDKIVSCLSPKPDDRPEAGWVHATLHRHCKNNYQALGLSNESSVGFIRIENSYFRRTYRGTTYLGRNNFLGSGIVGIPSRFLKLTMNEKGNYFVELLDKTVNLTVSGSCLFPGKMHKLSTGDILAIEGKNFNVILENQ